MDPSKYKSMEFYTEDQTRKISESLEKAITIPVNIEFESEQRIFNFSEMNEILLNSHKIIVQDCDCKTTYSNCDAPLDVCLSFDDLADELLDKGLYDSTEISVDKALEILQRSHEAGLVHMAYIMKGEDRPSKVCSCCPCCCHTLGSFVRNGVHADILTSRYIAVEDYETCINCGDCVDRCAFQARRMKKGKLEYNQLKCFGCGLCISTCLVNAINIVKR